MIRAERRADGLRISGHAGYGPPGQDIVCAAVSILTETLASCLPEERVRLGPGEAEFQCSGPEAAFVWRGLELLAKGYPRFVCLVEK